MLPNLDSPGNQSSDINPYASPTIPGGYDPSGVPGVGVWRDGEMLVVHSQATLPFICIETGEPAFGYRAFVLDWTYSFDLWRRQQQLLLPLSKNAYRSFRIRENVANLVIVLPIIALVIAFLTSGKSLSPPWYIVLIGAFLCGLVWAEILRRRDRKL